MYLAYQYNNTGTVASVSGWLTNTSNAQVTVSEKYAYDPLQRLVNSNVTSGLTKTLASFLYDSVGNRAQQVLNGIATTYTYNVLNNELTSSLASGVTTRYAYDNNGNLVSRVTGNTQWAFSWSPTGNLVSATNNTVTKSLYAYDGLGRRVESIEGETRCSMVIWARKRLLSCEAGSRTTTSLLEAPNSPLRLKPDRLLSH